MDKMKKLIADLFRKKYNKPADFIFSHEEFSLQTIESILNQEDFENIRSEYFSGWYKNYLDWKISGFSMNPQVSFFDNSKSKGIALHCSEIPFETNFYLSLMKYISDRCKESGYILKLSEVKSNQRQGSIEKIYKVYLKPSVRLSRGDKSVQLFGNLLMEFIAIDGKNHLFRLLANTYQDHKFYEAEDFDAFVKGILLNETF
jgi:hypothetical protein